MIKIPFPVTERRKALFVIDVQKEFLDSRNEYIIPNIEFLLQKMSTTSILVLYLKLVKIHYGNSNKTGAPQKTMIRA